MAGEKTICIPLVNSHITYISCLIRFELLEIMTIRIIEKQNKVLTPSRQIVCNDVQYEYENDRKA